MEVVGEERCKRAGTKWRCPQKAIPGRIYCEKHHLYTLSRLKRNRITNTNTNRNCNGNDDKLSAGISGEGCDSSSSSAAAVAVAVEPYRPVIDFSAAEVGADENVGWGFEELDGNYHFALGDLGTSGNYHFALPETGVGIGNDEFALGEGFGQFGWSGNDEFAFPKPGESVGGGFGQLGWSGNGGFALPKPGVGLDGGGGNDGFSLGGLVSEGFGQLGWSGNGEFALPKTGFDGGFLGANDGVGCERGNDDFTLDQPRLGSGWSGRSDWDGNDGSTIDDDVKCEDNVKIGTFVEKKVTLGIQDEGRIGKVGCGENVIVMGMEAKSGLEMAAQEEIGKVDCGENVIIMGMEAKSGVVGVGEIVSQGQKRKKGRSFGSEATKKRHDI